VTIARVHHLNCATMCPLAARWVLGVDRMVAHCLLLETARDGLVLVDTGFGTRDVARLNHLPAMFRAVVRPALAADETAIAQVRALGFQPEDVRHVVVTHLDLDHAGGLGDFPGARVHLHAREHAAAMARATRNERERYRTDHWAHGPAWEVYSEDGDTWRGLPAIARLRGIDADIGLLPLHGHTRGHSAIIARDGERWLVHAGDAYFDQAALGGKRAAIGFVVFENRIQIDGAARKRSLAALRTLHADHRDLDIFCAHDPREYARFSSPPA
jgi:glyoxylase-like metal-dependent hydrolase (beta-lactamase superfamily II)